MIEFNALGVVGFIRGSWVHWGAPWWSSGSFRVAGLIGVFAEGHPVYHVTLGSFGCVLWVVGFFRGGWVHRSWPWRSSV